MKLLFEVHLLAEFFVLLVSFLMIYKIDLILLFLFFSGHKLFFMNEFASFLLLVFQGELSPLYLNNIKWENVLTGFSGFHKKIKNLDSERLKNKTKLFYFYIKSLLSVVNRYIYSLEHEE